MTDIIKRAEQWLASIDDTRLFDGAGAEPLKDGPELVRALVAAYKELYEGCAEATRVSAIVETELLETIEEYRQTAKTSLTGINPDWPGNPGEGD